MNSPVNLVNVAHQSRQSSFALVNAGPKGRSRALSLLSLLIDKRKDDILEANTLDLEASREMAVPDIMLDWLRLTPERIQNLVRILNALSIQPDPLQQCLDDSYYTTDARVYGQRIPLGVIALVYESFPELGAIAAGLCIKSSNALILKGGAEASHSNQAITAIIQEVLRESGLPSESIHLLPTDQNDMTRELLTLNPHIQLLIPYGRPNLVQRVLKQATVPVIRTAISNCYLYCSGDAAFDEVLKMVIDSHQGEPDASNAIDKILVHSDCPEQQVRELLQALQDAGYSIKGDEMFAANFDDMAIAPDGAWSQPLWDSSILCKWVEDIDSAVDWINLYSSGHANCIATNSYSESRYFIDHTVSGVVYVNTSPRFQRYPSGGVISLGMSASNSYCGGPILARHLTSPKRVVYA